MYGEDFFRIVTRRIAEGEVDPDCLQRMQRNPICRACHEQYRAKYPGQPFKVKCEGIWEDDEIAEIAKEADIPFEEAKEDLNPAYWASRHIKLVDDDGQKTGFKARDYQEEILRCTAARKVDRTGRGMGKTTLGVIEELHKAITKRNFEILVVTPAKAQAQKWFTDIKDHIAADDDLRGTLAGTPRQAPYFEFRFKNGSNIRIFTMGSASGKKGDTVRTQTPRRTRIDEQDYLSEDDYKAIQAFFRRYKNSEVHGSSTPTGARGMYWKMCKRLPDYREFHFPITRHPHWNEEMEEACRAESRTELIFLHEYMAEFGELEAGVFKPEYIELAIKDYSYSQLQRVKNGPWRYFMGVDWNGQGVGTKIRVVGFHPETKIRRMVDTATISESTTASLNEIRRLNKKWACEEIYIDAGFGHVQDELLRLMGANSKDPDDKRLMDIHVIDFGANIETNKLVPKRNRLMYINDEENELQRRTKPFLVEGMQMIVEQGLFEFSRKDQILEEQMRSYRVKNYSAHGWANTYEAGDWGDHDLDACMLACLGIELKYGLFYEHRRKNTIASGMAYVAAAGLAQMPPPAFPEGTSPAEAAKQARMASANIPSRAIPTGDTQRDARVAWLGRNSAIVAPGRRSNGPRRNWGVPGVGSRTSIFRGSSPRRTF